MPYHRIRYPISRKAPGQSDCRLIPMKDGTIGFESPFDYDLKEALKAAIPWHDRRWDQDQKLWFVAPQWAETLADLAEKHGMGRPEVPEIPEVEEDDPWDVAAGDDAEFQDYGAQHLYPDHQYRVE